MLMSRQFAVRRLHLRAKLGRRGSENAAEHFFAHLELPRDQIHHNAGANLGDRRHGKRGS